jgi:hypothetical protein
MNISCIDQFGILLLLVSFAILGYKYMKYWQQLKAALQEENGESPLYSQKELNETAKKDLKQGSKMIIWNTTGAGQIIFSLKSDNPKVSVPLKRMRRVVFLFCITPFILAIVLTFITALSS